MPKCEIFRYVTEGSFDAYMWQTLETKARFIQQVMNGQTSVRSAEDLDGGALTYAEIKAIASGNPAVMEKVKIDTEIRKLDQLRAAHLNQQHSIRLQIRALPSEIKERQERIERLSADIATRDAHAGEEFSMTVGNRVYSGKGAREEGAAALTQAVLSWRDDLTLQVRGAFRGFEILSRGRGATLAGRLGRRAPAGAVHPGSGHLQGAAERRESGRDDAEHRTCAARSRQGRRRTSASAPPARKRCWGISGAGGQAVRARSEA